MKKLVLLILFAVCVINVNSQVQLLLNDGKTILSPNGKIDSIGRIEVLSNKTRKMYIDTSEVFAIITSTDTFFLYNNPQYPLSNAKYFVLGQQAGYGYKNILLYTTGAVVGFATPIVLKATNSPSFLSPIIVAIYVASTSSVGKKQIPQQFLSSEDYVRGYKLSATRKKVTNLSIYSFAGLVGGITVTYLLLK